MMSPDQIKEYFTILSPFFDAMKSLGVKGFEMALRQNYIYVIQDAIVLVFTTVLFLVVLSILRKVSQTTRVYNRTDECYKGIIDIIARDVDDTGFPIALTLVVATVVWSAVFFGEVFPMVNRLLNPEWTTLMDVVNLVGALAGK